MIYNLLSKPLVITVGGNRTTLPCAGHLTLYDGKLNIVSPAYQVLLKLGPGDAIIVEDYVADYIAGYCDLKMTIVFTPIGNQEPYNLQFRGIH